MDITDLGNEAMNKSLQKRREIAGNLMALNGNPDILKYVGGVCYDAVAFVRFLLGAKINIPDITTKAGEAWIEVFNGQDKVLWNGQNIDHGKAVIFIRQGEQKPFHAAIAIAEKTVRGVNGGVLGTGWCKAGDRDLSTLVKNGTSYKHDNKLIQVWISSK